MSIKTGFSNKYRPWYDGLIYRIQFCGIKAKSLGLMLNVLKNRYQRVILSGQTSEWVPILAGVHQGSIVGPLFF